MTKTKEEAMEVFVKDMAEAYSKEELARAIWSKMGAGERNPYFNEDKVGAENWECQNCMKTFPKEEFLKKGGCPSCNF